MRSSTLILFSLLALCAWPFRMKAQYSLLDLPRESQHATVMQRIGTTDITIDYHRPSVKGRTIWGDLVPYDQVWRAGANENTTFTTSSDVSIEGKPLPAGTYGLHMIPTSTSWTIIFSKDHGSWGSFFYKEANDALRLTVTPRACPMTEQVTYDFTDVTANSSLLTLRWEKLEVPIKIDVDVHAIVEAGMPDQLRGLSSFGWEAWYEAAHYAHQEKIAPEKAMKWVDASIARGANFENQSLKAALLEEAGQADKAKAIRDEMLEDATNADLNKYGYELANKGRTADAVKIFELNAKRHPEDPNVHDSLGRRLHDERTERSRDQVLQKVPKHGSAGGGPGQLTEMPEEDGRGCERMGEDGGGEAGDVSTS
jgi:hypothetical protein